jgi:hypothetical protein
MMGGILAAKYFDPSILVVNVEIKNTLIRNTLIYLAATINSMMCETIKSLGIIDIMENPTILQLIDISTIKLEGILEEIVILVYLWEYPTDFMILQPKTSLGGYLLILVHP